MLLDREFESRMNCAVILPSCPNSVGIACESALPCRYSCVSNKVISPISDGMGPVNWLECAQRDCDSFVSRPTSVGIVPVSEFAFNCQFVVIVVKWPISVGRVLVNLLSSKKRLVTLAKHGMFRSCKQ